MTADVGEALEGRGIGPNGDAVDEMKRREVGLVPP